jgi:hypothetical protein
VPYAAAALVFLTAGPVRASVSYIITVNTSAVAGTTGFLDFQFNPSNITSQAATATVAGFSGGGPFGAAQNAGNVTGTLVLPGTLVLTNSTPLNESFQAFTFGQSFSFELTLSGPAVDTPNATATAGSSFGIGLYNSAKMPILTNQALSTGFAAQVDIKLVSGATAPTAFPTATNGPSVVMFQNFTNPTPIPTLSEWGMILFSILLCGWGALRLRETSFVAPLEPGFRGASDGALPPDCRGHRGVSQDSI